jgi:FkbM family methyltransferase
VSAHAVRRLVRRCRPTIRQDIKEFVRSSVVHPLRRSLLNRAYRRLSMRQAGVFHDWFWDVFRDGRPAAVDGSWDVLFCGRALRVPLSPETLPLDWGIATALVGHDPEIKQTYAALLGSSMRPELFVDVGANFGTHSILWLAHGVDTLSFDPNPVCNAYHRRLCAANGLVARIHAVAVGDSHGTVDLSFPFDEPWYGSTDGAVRERLGAVRQLDTCVAEQRTLDDYASDMGGRRVLVKIDTEGNELAVLAGANRTLRETRPVVIFECWPHYRRRELHEYFARASYAVGVLPWTFSALQPLDGGRFADSPALNFIAVPAEHIGRA